MNVIGEMGRFDAYNTSDSTTGHTPLLANGTVTLGPFQADVAVQISGSVYADVGGTLYIEQSFDNGAHYDVSASYTVTGGAGEGFTEAIIAPILQVRYVNGNSPQTVMRLFSRTFFQGR